MAITNLADVKREHQRLLRELDAAMGDELLSAGRFAENYTSAHRLGFVPRSGAKGLARATGSKVVRTKGGRLVRIFNTKRYAAAIDSGSKAHEIRARRRTFLRFVVRGRVVFARRVWHPGTRATRFLWRATYAAFRTLQPSLETRLQTLFRRAR